MRKPHRLLGDILLKHNLITEEQMKSILDEMGVGDYRGAEGPRLHVEVIG
jgi:hypothetical protein